MAKMNAKYTFLLLRAIMKGGGCLVIWTPNLNPHKKPKTSTNQLASRGSNGIPEYSTCRSQETLVPFSLRKSKLKRES